MCIRKLRCQEKLRVELKTLPVQFAHLSERINTVGLLIPVGGATERSFRKIELLEFKEEEENYPSLILMMMTIMITLICFVRSMMKKITIYAQAVMRNLLPILFKHADI